jgi:hypothetical protein
MKTANQSTASHLTYNRKQAAVNGLMGADQLNSSITTKKPNPNYRVNNSFNIMSFDDEVNLTDAYSQEQLPGGANGSVSLKNKRFQMSNINIKNNDIKQG